MLHGKLPWEYYILGSCPKGSRKLIRGPFRKREQPSAIMKFSAIVLVSALSALAAASPISEFFSLL